MFKIIWLTFVVVVISFALSIVADNNGVVVITWLGYEVSIDVLSAIIFSFLSAFLIFILLEFVHIIFTFKYLRFLKSLFTRSPLSKLKKSLAIDQKAFDVMLRLLMAIEADDLKAASKLQRKLSSLIKNSDYDNYFLGKIALKKGQFKKSKEYFSEIDLDKNSKILALNSDLKLLLQKQDDDSALKVAKDILDLKSNDIYTLSSLFESYKNKEKWLDAMKLVNRNPSLHKKIKKIDLAIIYTSVAQNYYQQKNYLLAIFNARRAMSAIKNYLPAKELILTCWLDLGFKYKVTSDIVRMWKNYPHLVYLRVFDLAISRFSKKKQLVKYQSLIKANPNSHLSYFAVGKCAYELKNFSMAKENLEKSLEIEVTNYAKPLLNDVKAVLENKIVKQDSNAGNLENVLYYRCSSCDLVCKNWKAKCPGCKSYNSLSWNL